jgi:amino acid adenylation domain-containing protein
MSEANRSHRHLSPAEQRELLRQVLRERTGHRQAVHPLSPGQAGLLFIHRVAPESAAYNVSFPVVLRAPLDVKAFDRAWQGLVARHAALRTTYEVGPGDPVQRIHDHMPIVLEVVDAIGLGAGELHQRIVAAYRQPFELERGPVARIMLFRRSDTEHVLLLTVHHIACDGWSVGVLINDLLHLYAAESAGQAAALPPPPPPYTDFVHWQAELLAGPSGQQHREYWSRQLAGPLPVLDLPGDGGRRAGATLRGASHHFTLSRDLTRRLRERARSEGVTLFTVLLAAYQALLHRYSGQSTILVGSPTANRSLARFESVVGYFTNPVVLRAEFADDLTMQAHLRRTRDTVRGALEHAEYPFPLVARDLQRGRESGQAQVFQAMFNLMKLSQLGEAGASVMMNGSGPVRVGGVEVTPYPLDQTEGQFELAFELLETPAEVLGVVKYDAELVAADRVGRMAGHYEVLLEALATDPSCPVALLPLMTAAERDQILVHWNDTETPGPSEVCIHEMVGAQMRRTPDAPAVTFEGTTLTYRELDRRATALAGRLRGLGVERGTLVGLYVGRSLDMLVALLGVLKAGGAYVPLDPAYPEDRLRFMLTDGRVRVLVTQPALRSQLPQHEATVVVLEADGLEASATEPLAQVRPADLAYVIYTSGSTGRPKGVQIPHGAVVNFLHAMGREPGLAASDVLLSVTTLSFDIAVLELLLPLVVGARVEIVSSEVAADGFLLAEALRASGATVMQATPATWRMLVEAGWPGQPGLRMLCGGEALPRSLAEELLARGGELWNLYGPTETTVWSTIARVQAGDDPVSIGRPIANTRIYLLDRRGQPVPIGVPGELCIGGAGVAHGYLNRPELTAERFVEDRWGGQPGARLYRTGDLARYRADGRLEYLGRLDHQVKIRGHRVETGEIEAILRQDPDVVDAVVVLREDRPGDRRLVAYVVGDSRRAIPPVDHLRELARTRLPKYMVPSGWVFLPALPLTPNGKIDRKALPAPDDVPLPPDETYAPPRTPTEAALAAIWAETLGVERVGIHDDFFQLGGHSLLAAQVMARLRAALGVDLPLRSLFEAPSVGEQAAIIEALLSSTWTVSPGRAEGREEIEL